MDFKPASLTILWQPNLLPSGLLVKSEMRISADAAVSTLIGNMLSSDELPT